MISFCPLSGDYKKFMISFCNESADRTQCFIKFLIQLKKAGIRVSISDEEISKYRLNKPVISVEFE